MESFTSMGKQRLANTVMISGCDCRLGKDWIFDLLTQFGTARNYGAIIDLHTLQITAANSKSSPAHSVINSCFLVMYETVEIFSESESELLYDWRFTAFLASGPWRSMTRDFFSPN
jgi:hypothetical protein